MIPINLALRLAYPDADDKTLFEDVAAWAEDEQRDTKVVTQLEEERTIRELNIKAEALRKENAELAKRIEQLETEKANLFRWLDEKKAELSRANEKIEERDGENDALSSLLAAAQKDLRELQMANGRLIAFQDGDKNQLFREKKSLESTVERLEARVKELTATVANFKYPLDPPLVDKEE